MAQSQSEHTDGEPENMHYIVTVPDNESYQRAAFHDKEEAERIRDSLNEQHDGRYTVIEGGEVTDKEVEHARILSIFE